MRDPYVFDFLDITERVAERELESALMRRLEQFLLELGHGFAFVGRQYHFEVGDQDFYIDLLFFNWVQARFVVVELKVGRFEPEYVGKLGFYVSWIDDNLRNKDIHAPTVGILLCAGRNDNVVRYSLARTTAPLAVADYTYETLPSQVRDLVPTDDEIAAAVEATVSELDSQLPVKPDTLRLRGAIRFSNLADISSGAEIATGVSHEGLRTRCLVPPGASRSRAVLCPVDVDGFDGIEVKSESVAVLVESLVFRVIHRGVTFEDGNHPGMIVVGQSHGEFSCFVETEGAVGVREIEGTHSIVVTFFGTVADGHSPADSDGGLFGLPVGS